MLENRADIAVHSMKDVPVDFPPGLGLAVICERDDPHDAFVSNQYATIYELPQGAIVGTSSLRRQCQLRPTPDLQIHDLRGNVNSRLAKLDAGDYDAIILAAAGLRRLRRPIASVRYCHQNSVCQPMDKVRSALNVASMMHKNQVLLAPLGTCHDALLCDGGTGHEPQAAGRLSGAYRGVIC